MAGDRAISAGDVSNSIFNTGDIFQGIQSEALDRITLATLDRLTAVTSERVAIDVENLREQFRSGDMEIAYKGIRDLKLSPVWDTYDPKVKGAVLRAEASMLTSMEGRRAINEVNQLLSEAEKIEPEFDARTFRLRAQVVEGGPHSIEEPENVNQVELLNIWLSCLLQTGREKDILAIRENWGFDFTPNAETHRFYALALLVSGDSVSSMEEIERSRVQEPKWHLVRYTAAIIDYFSALSPSIPRYTRIPYPRPVFQAWVKEDDASQQRLGEANKEFLEVSKSFKQGSQDRKDCELWAFACLANFFPSDAKAIEFGKELLDKDPSNPRLLSWFLGRNSDFDEDRSFEAIKAKIAGKSANVEDVMIAVALYSEKEMGDEALALLDENRASFEQAGAIDNWHYARAQVFIHKNLHDDAKAEADNIATNHLKRIIESNMLVNNANKNGDWKPVAEFHRQFYEEDGEAEAFLTVFEIYARNKLDDAFVVENAEKYIELMQTAAAVGFTVEALFTLNEFESCVDLLDKHRRDFRHGDLPDHLKRIEIYSLASFNIRSAVKKAEDLLAKSETVPHLMLMIELYLSKGDLLGLVAIAKRLLARKDAEASTLLAAAQLVKVKNVKLAERLVHRAQEIGYSHDPRLIAFAHDIASRIGAKDVASQTMRELIDLSKRGEGPLTMMGVEEFLNINRESAESFQQLEKQYATGEIPIHFYSNQRNISFVNIFHTIAGENADKTNVTDRSRLFTRHGARIFYPAEQFQNSNNWNLHIDNSSLLIANKLGILDLLEDLYPVIKIPAKTIKALIEQRDRLRHHQREQVDNSLIVTDLVRREKIHQSDIESRESALAHVLNLLNQADSIPSPDDIETPPSESSAQLRFERLLGDRLASIADALQYDGLAVGFLPLKSLESGKWIDIELPQKVQTCITNALGIIEALAGHSLISQEKYEKAKSNLGQEALYEPATCPMIGSKLFLMNGLAELLAGTGVLEDACDHFSVYLSPASIRDAQHASEFEQKGQPVGSEIDELIERLNIGIDDGKYEFIKQPRNRPVDDEIDGGKFGLDLASVTDLLTFELQEWDVICVDDRHLTRHAIRKENEIVAPLIGIPELLSALFSNGKIDEHEYNRQLLELRRSNYRYLPLTKEEILFYLLRAPIGNKGAVTETEPLLVLRQYYASCLLDDECIQLTNDPFTEFPFIARSVEAISGAIGGVWSENSTDNVAAARADWLLENMYTGYFGVSHLPIVKAETNAAEMIALEISGLLIQSVLIPESGHPLDEPKRRPSYMNWLTSRILKCGLALDPEIKTHVSRILLDNVLKISDREYANDQDRLVSGLIIGRFYLSLPTAIRESIVLDSKTAELMAVRQGKFITIDRLDFEAADYWSAVTVALSGEIGTASAVDDESVYSFSQVEQEDISALIPLIRISNSETDWGKTFRDPSFGLLLEDEQARAEALQQTRYMFDCDHQTFEKLAAEILSVVDPIERVDRFFTFRHSSLRQYYQDLERRMRQQASVFWNELVPPDVHNLLGYHRIPDSLEGRPFGEIWNESASTLCEEEGLEVALSRCINLPFALPATLSEQFLQLSPAHKIAILERLAREWASPLRLLQCANLAMRANSTDGEELLKVTTDLLDRVYDPKTDESSEPMAFFRVLVFSADEIRRRWKISIPAELSLFAAWSHASMLYHIHRGSGFTEKDIYENFTNRPVDHEFEFFDGLIVNSTDVLVPSRVNQRKLLTHAAAKLFGANDPQLIAAASLPDRIRKEVFSYEGSPTLPATELLNDPLLGEDNLESLFGDDRFEIISAVIGPENLDLLRSSTLESSVNECLKTFIEDPKRVDMLFGVYGVVADLPIYEDLRPLYRQALMAIDIGAVMNNDSFSGTTALLAAASQLRYVGDDAELKDRFREYYQRAVEFLESQPASDKRSEDLLMLMNVARSVAGPLETAESYITMMTMMDELRMAWPEAERVGYLLAQAPWSTRPEISRHLWREVLRLRTGPKPL